MAIERRFTVSQKFMTRVGRSNRQIGGTGPQLAGHASVFYNGTPATEYILPTGAHERIDQSAFNRAMTERHDVAYLFNHDPNFILGRVSSGTLRLSVDSTGLRYVVDLPQDGKNPLSDALWNAVLRGDVYGASFGFEILDERWTTEGGKRVRLIRDLQLWDVSAVTYAAYSGASTGILNANDPRTSSIITNYDRAQLNGRIRKLEENVGTPSRKYSHLPDDPEIARVRKQIQAHEASLRR